MQIRDLTDEDYQTFVELEEYSFQTGSIEKRHKRMKDIWTNSIKFGVFSDNCELESALIIRDYSIYFCGKEMRMGGVGNVASYPELRGQGNISSLFNHALKVMKKEGMLVSYLDPFSYKFYRRYGYELVFEERLFRIKPSEFNHLNSGNRTVRRVQWKNEHENIMSIYHEKYSKALGPINRDPWSWNEVNRKFNKIYYAICENSAGQLEGYISYSFQKSDKNMFVINEIVGLNIKAEKVLWEFAASHGSQVDIFEYQTASTNDLAHLFNEPSVSQRYYYGMMARIVDIENFIKSYPFKVFNPDNISFYLIVEDPIANWNNGTFKLTVSDQEIDFSRVSDWEMSDYESGSNVLKADIQTWTQIFMKSRSALDLHYQESLLGDKELVKFLNNLLPNKRPELYDRY